MEDVCVFVEYNGQWDGIQSYVGGEMKGILVPESATYVGLIELVRSAIGIWGPAKTIVMRYGVEPGLPLVMIQCDADVKFYIQLKKKDVHVLSKFPITIDVLDESAAEAMPPELRESNHIDTFPHPPPPPPSPPPHIPPLPPHVDESKFAGDARQSNENSIAASIGAHSIANYTTSQSVNVPSSDSVSGSLVVADYTPVTIRINNIFENKKLLQYHLHHDAMSKHYQFKVKRSNSTLLHVICIDIEKCQWQLRATRMRGSELFVVKRYDDVHTCSIEIVQGHHRQAKSWMIGECVKAKYLDSTNTSYRPREIMRDMQAEFGMSFNYLRAWRGKEAALTSLRGDDAESYNVLPAWAEMVKRKNHGSDIDIETDSENYLQCLYMCLAALKHACGHDANGCIFPLAFGIVQSKSNESWKWFFEKLRASIGTRESLAIVADRHKGIEFASNLVYPDDAFGICIQYYQQWPADQFEYAVTNNACQIWIVDMSERTCTCRRFQLDQIHCPHAMASILLAAQMAGMFQKKSGHKLSILPKQSVSPEGHGLEGFCLKEKNMSLFGAVDVMVMDTTDKPVPIQYP
ncbi:hypothetical protein TIFTF001_017612 [Ficus carica]|uniref:SWIM-type domain-containing protein n=1 Tax=Ficus carica TaxID=3494 RepID=A0AA88D9X7_FICCA|nr:hypothetical protein TIFTF001_017612 [Ficus carica]